MDIFTIQNDIPVFGFRVKNFPDGIQKEFDHLTAIIGGFNQPVYGISWMVKDEVFYYAMAEEERPDQAEQHGAERKIISKGKYLSVVVKDWRTRTASINGIFHAMLEDPEADPSGGCLECYKSDTEMLCLVKARS